MYVVRPLIYEYIYQIEDKDQVTTNQRISSLIVMMPAYYMILLFVGFTFGRFHYVKNMALRPLLFLKNKLT